MPRKGLIGGNPPKVIQIINGGAGIQFPNLSGIRNAAANATANAASAAASAVENANKIVEDPLTSTLNILNSNPYLIGVFYLFLNLGGRFLSMELTKRQEWFLSQPYLRPFILFAVMFISTRNLAVAFWTTVGLLLIFRVFANENSAFCLIPGWKEKLPDNTYETNMKIFKRADLPDDGHIESSIHSPIKNSENNIKHSDPKPNENNIKQDNKANENNIKQEINTKDDYVNTIKDDPVGHENIKETYADYGE